MYKLTGNRVFLLFFGAIQIAFATQIAKIPDGASEYPLVLLICSSLLTIALFVKPQKEEISIGKENSLRILVFTILIGISLLLLTKIGYILSTILFLYSGLWFLKLKKGLLFYLFPIVLSLAMYFLFSRGLSVILPEGAWVSLNL
ncbi:tripartite tricarboxylate transporter TctB family protein [Sphaerochaeta sp. PS]|uniref:tripartite tricarboxylate transporter TctB family protein n=1 Tax=Sphaerochaeta sp. PS TaxID=3076336 RepID=UPI0028A35C68|nr:tripartite tricarboxylate transporter TctB family protein [Sphaerochaeta sp. PS]MDT4762990.1 tripartite tricarboxylate transporter TctB family protein [Sphaerochaeta sp. PS]